jgi:hypothetical protein
VDEPAFRGLAGIRLCRVRTGPGLLPEWIARAVQHWRIGRCAIGCSIVLYLQSDGFCCICSIERFPKAFKACRLAGSIAIGRDWAGGARRRIDSPDGAFCYVYF